MASLFIILCDFIMQMWHHLVYSYYFIDRTKSMGINFEGGKIITHIKSNPLCVAASNIQIAIDSPFFGYQSNCKILEYPEIKSRMLDSISSVFKKVNFMLEEDSNINHLVVQIAKEGSVAYSFGSNALLPILRNTLSKENIDKLIIVKGYRSTDYYVHRTNGKFIFVNIGMFTSLNPECDVAEVCVPVKTIVLEHQIKGKTFIKSLVNYHIDDIAYGLPLIKPVELAGIPDNSNFILPNNISYKHLLSFFID
ncbi:putative ORFan [Tupanvirus deep ocean]|uniref:ORFan n=2 Tax=Tupanvirus TaxID=2094720 RepID=A0AC62A7P2_9VIRU|nr:putative ORFan [Tupanvirus deep ocean]QKU33672.1 putative ORFan [Tupanvirus deep ocean]